MPSFAALGDVVDGGQFRLDCGNHVVGRCLYKLAERSRRFRQTSPPTTTTIMARFGRSRAWRAGTHAWQHAGKARRAFSWRSRVEAGSGGAREELPSDNAEVNQFMGSGQASLADGRCCSGSLTSEGFWPLGPQPLRPHMSGSGGGAGMLR